MVAHWTITLAREGAAIVVRGEGDDPHAPDRIDYEVRGDPGGVYRALLDLVAPGPWSIQAGRMKDERDLYWIADCAYTEALLHPEWSVETDLPPLLAAEEIPEGGDPVRGEAQPGDRTDTSPWFLKEIVIRESGPAMVSFRSVAAKSCIKSRF